VQTLNFWAFFSLAEAFFIACMGSFVLSRGVKDKRHILFFLCCMGILLRLVTEFGFRYSDKNSLWIWQKLDAFWPFAPALFLHFVLAYTKNKLYKNKVFILFHYLPVFIFLYIETFNLVKVTVVYEYFGYDLSYKDMLPYAIITNSWAYLCVFSSAYLLFNYWKNISNVDLKRKLLLLFWSIMSVGMTGFLLDYFLKTINIHLPFTNDTLLIIGTILISFGIIKYDLFSPEKETAKKIKDLQAIYFLKNTSVGIIHEMKNKFFALVSKVDLLRRHTRECENPGCLRVIGLMRDNARDINEFINKILLYVKQEGEPFYNFNLAALIEEAIDSIGSLVPQGLTIRREFSDSLPIYCNANDLKSVVVNLLLNAFDAVNDGSGEVYIGTQKAVIKNREYSRLTVKDNGKGIAQEHLDSVFELMYTTKQEGSGFGLFFVKKIIEKYRGIIEVQSEPGRGTTFEIYLPLRGKA